MRVVCQFHLSLDQFNGTAIDYLGNAVDLAEFAGNVTIVVNVATF